MSDGAKSRSPLKGAASALRAAIAVGKNRIALKPGDATLIALADLTPEDEKMIESGILVRTTGNGQARDKVTLRYTNR